MFRSRDIKSSFHSSSDPQNFANATQTALQGSQSLRLPQSLRLYRQRFTQSALRGSRSAAHAMKSAVPVRRKKKLHLPRALQLKVLKALRTKCRFCHETCYWRCSKCCACNKCALPMRKVPLLPRNLLLEVLKVLLRLPRNLQFQCTKCCARHDICTSRFTSHSAAKAVCSGRRSSL